MSVTAAPRSAPEIVLPVCLAGLLAMGLGGVALAQSSTAELAGPLLLLAAAVAADRFSMPAISETMDFSLSFVFVLASAVLYGAATGAVLASVSVAFKFVLFERFHPPVRTAYNLSQVALSAGAAGLVSSWLGGAGNTVPSVAAAAGVYLAVNLALVTVVVVRTEHLDPASLLVASVPGAAVPFALAVSLVPLFVVAWESSKAIAISALLPLAAVALYFRSMAQNRTTLELALTDPLTGLGNRRHFDERLRFELDRADAGSGPLSLVLLDLDAFKNVNDRLGHDAGDQLLQAAAAALRQGGEAFRYGGDEFALVLAGKSAAGAAEVVEAVRARMASLTAPGAPVHAAFGVATYPDGGIPRDELVRSADRLLYDEKRSRGSGR